MCSYLFSMKLFAYSCTILDRSIFICGIRLRPARHYFGRNRHYVWHCQRPASFCRQMQYCGIIFSFTMMASGAKDMGLNGPTVSDNNFITSTFAIFDDAVISTSGLSTNKQFPAWNCGLSQIVSKNLQLEWAWTVLWWASSPCRGRPVGKEIGFKWRLAPADPSYRLGGRCLNVESLGLVLEETVLS